jgi:hypothetical protein
VDLALREPGALGRGADDLGGIDPRGRPRPILTAPDSSRYAGVTRVTLETVQVRITSGKQ